MICLTSTACRESCSVWLALTPRAGFLHYNARRLSATPKTNSPFISTLFVNAAEGTLHCQFHPNKNIQWAPKLMFKRPHNASQRSALSLNFNFGVNLFQESRIVSLAKTTIEKGEIQRFPLFVCLLAIVQQPKLSTKTKYAQSLVRTLS